MCDTFVATPTFTGTGTTIFGKNSDREPNEAQAIVRYPRTKPDSKDVQATFIRVPQVEETYEVILSKPLHMWGAEIGANEFGVVIGNEAVFTKVKIAKKNTGLTGMDMLRLTLERSRSAREALDHLAYWIENYDQDACGGYTDKNFYYHNSFVIADAEQAFVVETAGRHWVAATVTDFRSISNGLTIETEYEFHSPGLPDYARRKGLADENGKINFRRAFSDRFYTHFSRCQARQALSTAQGTARQFGLDAPAAMEILRTHAVEPATTETVSFHKQNMGSLCLHATGLLTPSQTTGSMVAELRPQGPSTFWLTGTAAPCLSVFKPFFMGGETLNDRTFPQPTAQADGSLWWRHERLHRKFLQNHPRLEEYQAERRRLESSLIGAERQLIGSAAPTSRLDSLSAQSITQQDELVERFLAEKPQGQTIEKSPRGAKLKLPFLYRRLWQGLSRKVGLKF